MYLNSQTTHFSTTSFAVVCVFVFAFAPGLAAAYFSDTNNKAADSSFATGLVDATLSTNDSNQDLTADTVTSFTLTTDDDSTLATQSRLSFAPQSCRADLYNEILLEVTTASGTTAGTFADVVVSETGVPGTYTLDVIASADLVAVSNESCVIEATLETWQTEFLAPDAGFTSVQTTSFTLTTTEPIGPQETTTVVLNELYPAVLSTTTIPLEREWVELYNGTSGAVDVAGWRVDEYVGGTVASGSRPHTIVSTCASVTASDHMQPLGSGSTIIPAGGFLVVEFCGSASYLSDGGDTVELYNAGASQVDIHTYPATANGKSHARIPDGAVWVDPVPTPGNKNTATRADLEAEGWDEATIDSTLALLEADNKTQASSTGSQSSSPAVNTLPTTQATGTTSNFSFNTNATNASSALSTTASTTVATGTSKAASSSAKTASSTATDRASSSMSAARNTATSTAATASTTVASSSNTQVPLPGETPDSTQVANAPAATTTKPALPADESTDAESAMGDEPPIDTEAKTNTVDDNEMGDIEPDPMNDTGIDDAEDTDLDEPVALPVKPEPEPVLVTEPATENDDVNQTTN